METKVLVARSWEDIVFANRNREYGAYALRKEYSRRMLMSWGFTTAMLALLVIWSQVAPEHVPVIKPPILIGDIKLIEPPVLPARPPVQKQQQVKTEPVKKIETTNTTPVVVKDPVADPPIDQIVEPVAPVVDGPVSQGNDATSTDGVTNAVSDVPAETGPRSWAEVMPKYDGGMKGLMKFVQKHLRFPASAKRLGVGGTVYVSFVVDCNGQVKDVTILSGISADCDLEAKRVIQMLPGWTGGKQNGQPVSVKMVLPITFQVNK